MRKKLLFLTGLTVFPALCSLSFGQSAFHEKIEKNSTLLDTKVINWRHDFHQNPELGNREFRTSKIIADHLRSLGMEVQTGVAHTGVVGLLKGGKPGPVVALRADIDGLPVTERVDVPFKSMVTTEYNGQKTGVMHACGHDTHIAILMGVAEVLAGMKQDLKGTVKFIFQPAEEGAPEGEQGGAELMVKEGVLENPKVDVIFGLHINSQTEVGQIKYRPGGTLAAVDQLSITVKGKQTHDGAYPWAGVDPIVTSAQIITGLQTIVSRNLNLTQAAAVVTIGAIHGGIRQNIIPEEVKMIGTIRTLDETMHTQAVLPTLKAMVGKSNVILTPAHTGAEDFSFFQQKIPGFFFFLGGMPKGKMASESAPHHIPDFAIDYGGMLLGVKTLSRLADDYLDRYSITK